jgi:hypothetical protein
VLRLFGWRKLVASLQVQPQLVLVTIPQIIILRLGIFFATESSCKSAVRLPNILHFQVQAKNMGSVEQVAQLIMPLVDTYFGTEVAES